MFEQVIGTLESAVGDLHVPVDGGAIVRSLQVADRLTAHISAAVGGFDAAEVWREEGATSMTAWLRAHGERSQREAASLARTARRLNELPVTAEAYRDGMLSTGQVQVIVVNLNDETTPLFAEAETDLVPQLAALPVDKASSVMQAWARAAKDSLKDPADPESETPERSLHLSKTLGGRRELSGSFDPETGALTETALRLAQTEDLDEEPSRTPAEKRADAFADIMRHFLDNQQNHTGGRHRPHLNIFIDLDTLNNARSDNPAPGEPRPHPGPAGASGTTGSTSADNLDPAGPGDPASSSDPTNGGGGPGDRGSWTEASSGTVRPKSRWPKGGWLTDGTILNAETIDRLACDAALHRVLTRGGSSILDYGTTSRTIPANLYNALIARDQHCRFPGCDRPPQWCEGHHLHHWEHGGPTSLDNLVLLCSRHHHLFHQPNWAIRHKPDGTLEITKPGGETLVSRPPGKPPDLFHPAA